MIRGRKLLNYFLSKITFKNAFIMELSYFFRFLKSEISLNTYSFLLVANINPITIQD